MARAKKKSALVKKSKTTKLKKKVVKKATAKRSIKKVTAIPKGYHSITPYLIVGKGAEAITFYKKAFGAKELMRMEHGGKIGHAELQIGDARIMLGDTCPEMNALSPENYGGSPVCIHLYIKDVDGVVKRAVAAGAKLLRPVEDKFYGDRMGALQDPFGHVWSVATHVENVTPAQIRKRAAELFGKKSS